MTTDEGRYQPPEYINALCPQPGGGGFWLPCCTICGAVVMRPLDHNDWHAHLWVALTASASRQTS